MDYHSTDLPKNSLNTPGDIGKRLYKKIYFWKIRKFKFGILILLHIPSLYFGSFIRGQTT